MACVTEVEWDLRQEWGQHSKFHCCQHGSGRDYVLLDRVFVARDLTVKSGRGVRENPEFIELFKPVVGGKATIAGGGGPQAVQMESGQLAGVVRQLRREVTVSLGSGIDKLALLDVASSVHPNSVSLDWARSIDTHHGAMSSRDQASSCVRVYTQRRCIRVCVPAQNSMTLGRIRNPPQ